MRARCALCVESWQIGEGHACPPKSQQNGVDTFVHPPPEAEALAAVELFESVGAHEFGVTVKDEATGRCDYDVLTGEGLRGFLPGLLKQNAAARESVISQFSVLPPKPFTTPGQSHHPKLKNS